MKSEKYVKYCSRIGKQKMGHNRPISVTIGRRDDKEKIMGIKSKLPQGIYVKSEYPIHIKRARNTLWLILRYAESLPSYRDKSKIEGDHLVINRTNYRVNDIHKLLPDKAAYKAAQKEDEHHIAFHGELSPCSNFHRSKFTINNHTYHSSEQWI